MAEEKTYSHARANFAKLLERVCREKEEIYITRRGKERAALISASELESWKETVHLLRSPRNAERLLAALARAAKGEGRRMTVEELRKELGLDHEETSSRTRS